MRWLGWAMYLSAAIVAALGSWWWLILFWPGFMILAVTSVTHGSDLP